MVKENINRIINFYIFICIALTTLCFLTTCKKKQTLIGPDVSFTYAAPSAEDILNGTINTYTIPFPYEVNFTITNYDPINYYEWQFENVSSGYQNIFQATSQVMKVSLPEGTQETKLIAINSFGTTQIASNISFYSTDTVARFTGVVNFASNFSSYKIILYGYDGNTYSYNYATIKPLQTNYPASTSASFDFSIKLKSFYLQPRYNVKYKIAAIVYWGTSNSYTTTLQLFTLAAINNFTLN